MSETVVQLADAAGRPELGCIGVVIPALNEERSLAELLPLLAGLGLGQVVVGDNGSTDGTARVVTENGFDVVLEPRRGYGAACAAAIAVLRPKLEIVVFLDADMADDPRRIVDLVAPIQGDRADLVIGYRDPALRAPGSMSVAQVFGNWLATGLIRLGWGVRFHDLGPFRAISRSALDAMQMRDRAYGWTVEMQVRAVQMNLRIEQIPVAYRKRVGVSKISGTIRGVILAGYYILTTIARLYFRRRV